MGRTPSSKIERILGKTEEDRRAKELSKQQAESALLLLAISEGRLMPGPGHIAHRKGYRDCKITTPSGTVKMWAAGQPIAAAQAGLCAAGRQAAD